jgi:hypothetical protein
MTDMIYGSPLFATSDETVLAMANKPIELPFLGQENTFAWTNDLMGVDVHVKSPAGRWNGSSWVNDDVISPAIDAGAGDVRDEPSPNGNLVNIGYYGGTPTASKTPPADVSLGDITVIEDDWTRPGFSLTLGGSGNYHVAVYFCYGTSAGSTDGTNGWANVLLVNPSASLGENVLARTKEYFNKADTIHCNIVVMSGDEVLASKATSTVLTAEPPPFRGHGGGENIIHVRAGAVDELRVVASSGTVFLDNIEISRAKRHGLDVSGGVSLVMNRVRLLNNGTDTAYPSSKKFI